LLMVTHVPFKSSFLRTVLIYWRNGSGEAVGKHSFLASKQPWFKIAWSINVHEFIFQYTLTTKRSFGPSILKKKLIPAIGWPFMLLFVINKINLGSCIMPTQPYWTAVGVENTVCYLGNTAVNQNKRSTPCHRWGLNLRSSAC
jgi:hypothetical protein